MSWEWTDRDLFEWAQKTLPEFLVISTQDPHDKGRCIAKTPWEGYEITLGEVSLEGEANLIGKKAQSFFQFDMDISFRLDIEKKAVRKDKDSQEPVERQTGMLKFDSKVGMPKMEDLSQTQPQQEDLYWPALAQLQRYENSNVEPGLALRMEEVPQDVADEVRWYLKEGMGRHYLWHGLARWHAYAVKKWTRAAPPPILDVYTNPEPAPLFPPFREAERRRYEDEVKRTLLDADSDLEEDGPEALAADIELTSPSALTLTGAKEPMIGRKPLEEEVAYKSPDASDEEDDYEPWRAFEYDEYTMEKRRKGAPFQSSKLQKYPFLPSMLCGVGGPSTDWLAPKQFALDNPHRPENKVQAVQDDIRKKKGVTNLDVIMDKARKKRQEFEQLANGRQIMMRAQELCEAIEKGEIMRAFAKLDEQTASCPHPDTGRCAAHCCVIKGSSDLLQMVVEAKADVNAKDHFGQTALMMAAKQGNSEMSKILLDAGADAAEEDVLGRSAGDMVKVLPSEPDNPLKGWKEKLKGDPVPEDPAKKSRDLKTMIEDRERPKKYGQMLLDAIKQKDVRTAEASIEAGGDVNILDDRGDSVLLLLAKGKWKDQEGVQVRLTEKAHKAGGKLDFQNGQGNTPLLFAAHRGCHSMVEALLQLRADPALVNEEGNTALMYAAHGGHEAICTALLEAYSPSGIKNKYGLTAQEMAQKRGFTSCAVLVHAYELAPKKRGLADEVKPGAKKEKRKKDPHLAFDYSRWNKLEKDMQEDEELEQNVRDREAQEAMKKPTPKMEDMGPEAFGLPADTPWPPTNPANSKQGAFDYSRWDKIVDDIEKHEKIVERYEDLQKNPQYEWRDGQKMQIIF